MSLVNGILFHNISESTMIEIPWSIESIGISHLIVQ